MTQSHHDVISLVIVMFFSLEINTFAHADVVVLIIPFGGRQDVLVSTGYSEYCITCARITVLLYIPLCEHI
jgi:nitrate/TMAO reductase-like tetraheme cytochrome c subunit